MLLWETELKLFGFRDFNEKVLTHGKMSLSILFSSKS